LNIEGLPLLGAEDHRRDAGRLRWDQEFESGFLQRRVSKLSVPAGKAWFNTRAGCGFEVAQPIGIAAEGGNNDRSTARPLGL
jgi:hypothetical protein